MSTHHFLRRAITALSTALVVIVVLPAAASADTPASWPADPHVSGLDWLLVLGLIPLGLAAVISLLAALPSMIKDKGYQPGQSWRSEAEWFGGPRKAVASTNDESTGDEESDQGGTSARW